MRNLILLVACLAIQKITYSQTALQLVKMIQDSQKKLKTVAYTLQRHDTLVTGTIRTITGHTKIQTNPADSIFGFSFWSKRDDVNSESIYDSNISIEINHDSKQYEVNTNPEMLKHFLGKPGGQIVFTELVKLDTSKVLRYELLENAEYYYLTMHRPEIKQYDVTNRFNTFTIDKKLMLPVAMKSHQETLGKVQDLFYKVTDIQINNPAYTYNFSGQRFPGNYKLAVPSGRQVSSLKDKTSPVFELNSFNNQPVSSGRLSGKVVLLDFWEVWCGPCIASMPKVDSLYTRYKARGLEVYGITNDEKQLESARLLVQKMNVKFQMLKGNEQIKKSFAVAAIPFYVVINRQGIITFLSYGYSDELETEIKKNL